MVVMGVSALSKVGQVVLPPQPQFIAAERFSVGISDNKIRLGNNFRERFIGKVEEPMAATTLCYVKLTRPLPDSLIIAELGNKAETTLSQAFALMEDQPNGEQGVLVAGDEINVFYITDAKGIRRMVYVCRGRKRWFVGASFAGDQFALLAGCRIFRSA